MLHILIVHAHDVSKHIPRDSSATPRKTLTHLSCSPNFPRASYLDERTLTYEPIVNWCHDIGLKNYCVRCGNDLKGPLIIHPLREKEGGMILVDPLLLSLKTPPSKWKRL